jgi:hypothetical protein
MKGLMDNDAAAPNAAYTFNLFGNSTFQGLIVQNFKGFESEMETAGFTAYSSSEAEQSFSGIPEYPTDWRTNGYIAAEFHPPTFLQIVAILKEPFSKELVAWSL